MSDGYMIPDDKSIQQLIDEMPENWDDEYKDLTISFYQQHDTTLKYKRQLAAARTEVTFLQESEDGMLKTIAKLEGEVERLTNVCKQYMGPDLNPPKMGDLI